MIVDARGNELERGRVKRVSYVVYDITDPDSAGFTAQRTMSFLSVRFGFTLKPVSAMSSRDNWAGPVLES